MAAEMFGVPGGIQAYESHQSQLALNNALARLHQANAAESEAKAFELSRMMQILGQPDTAVAEPEAVGAMQGLGRGSLASATDILARDAQKLAAAGLVGQASKLATTVADLHLKNQQELTSRDQGRYRQSQVLEKNLSEINGLLSGVVGSRDPQTAFNQARMLFMSRHPELREVPAELQTYDPATVGTILEGTKEGLARLRQVNAEAETESRVEERNNRNAFRDFRKTYLTGRRQDQLNEWERRRKETGGPKAKDIGGPAKTSVDFAKSLLDAEFKGLSVPEEELEAAAYDTAAQAKAFRKGNPGVDDAQAVRHIFENVTKKNFTSTALSYMERTKRGLAAKSILGPLAIPEQETRYRPGLAARGGPPLPLPKDAVGKPDPTKLEIGRNYILRNGQVGKWTGQGFAPEAAPTGPTTTLGTTVPAIPPDEGDTEEE